MITIIYSTHQDKEYNDKFNDHLVLTSGLQSVQVLPYVNHNEYSLSGTVKSLELVFIPVLAILVIFITCFNYIILSVSLSLKRAKEIGFNKVIGARRSHIIKLFLSETVIITFLAFFSASSYNDLFCNVG